MSAFTFCVVVPVILSESFLSKNFRHPPQPFFAPVGQGAETAGGLGNWGIGELGNWVTDGEASSVVELDVEPRAGVDALGEGVFPEAQGEGAKG
jgi:hypothetical protein